MKQFKPLMPVLAAALLMLSCTKEGPEGPQGPQGNPGPQGTQGTAGAQGSTGTANVIYSGWLSFQQAQRDSTIDNSKLKVNHIPAAQLTQEIIDNGVVLVYIRFLTSVMQLPYTSYAGSKANTVSFLPKPQRIFITRFTHDNSGSLGFGAIQFRYILVPGGVAAGRYAGDAEKKLTINGGTYTVAQLKAMSYDQVSALLNIPE